MVVPSNVHDDFRKGSHIVGWSVTVFVFRKFLCGFHKMILHVRQILPPSPCSDGDLARCSRRLLLAFRVSLVLLGQPRNNHEQAPRTSGEVAVGTWAWGQDLS